MTHGFTTPPRRMDLVRDQWGQGVRRDYERMARAVAKAALDETLRRPLIPEKRRVREYGP